MACLGKARIPLRVPTAATEVHMRQQADALSAALTIAGVENVNRRRPCGLHLAATRWRR